MKFLNYRICIKMMLVMMILPINFINTSENAKAMPMAETRHVNYELDCKAKFWLEFNRLKRSVNVDSLRGSIKDVVSDFKYGTAQVSNLDDDVILSFESSRQLNNIPFNLYYRMVCKESDFIETAMSSDSAVGYMQITRIAYRDVTKMKGYSTLPPYESQTSIDNIIAGSAYIKWIADRADNNHEFTDDYSRWVFILSAYNAGYSKASVAVHKFKETRVYVDKIMERDV